MVKTSDDLHTLLLSLGAKNRLIEHVKIVGSTADRLLSHVEAMGVEVDSELVQLGAACHDAGKILYPNELDESGSLHEQAGEELLLKNSVSAKVARFCKSHAQYMDMEVCYEELLVALADKLWKGKRVSDLELRVIDSTAEKLRTDRWEIFDSMDMCFEKIASDGDRRLESTKQV